MEQSIIPFFVVEPRIKAEFRIIADLVVSAELINYKRMNILGIAMLENAENQVAIFVFAPPRHIARRCSRNRRNAQTLVWFDLVADKMQLGIKIRVNLTVYIPFECEITGSWLFSGYARCIPALRRS
jgi:hypothetical protein